MTLDASLPRCPTCGSSNPNVRGSWLDYVGPEDQPVQDPCDDAWHPDGAVIDWHDGACPTCETSDRSTHPMVPIHIELRPCPDGWHAPRLENP